MLFLVGLCMVAIQTRNHIFNVGIFVKRLPHIILPSLPHLLHLFLLSVILSLSFSPAFARSLVYDFDKRNKIGNQNIWSASQKAAKINVHSHVLCLKWVKRDRNGSIYCFAVLYSANSWTYVSECICVFYIYTKQKDSISLIRHSLFAFYIGILAVDPKSMHLMAMLVKWSKTMKNFTSLYRMCMLQWNWKWVIVLCTLHTTTATNTNVSYTLKWLAMHTRLSLFCFKQKRMMMAFSWLNATKCVIVK